MRILAVRDGGRIDLEGDRYELERAWEMGLCWKAQGVWQTRIWYLAPFREVCPVPLDFGTHKADLVEQIRLLRTIPAPVPQSYSLDAELRDYQLLGCGLMLGRPHSLLADSTGLGKSVQSGTVLGHRLREGQAGIVITTLSARDQWVEELVSKIGACDARSVVLPPAPPALPKKRHAAYAGWAANPAGRVLVLHHEAIRGNDTEIIAEAVAKVASERYVTCIFDEVGYMKNRTSQLFLAAMRIGQLCTYRVALTATPIENQVGDLWALMHWLHPDYMSPVTAFERRHVNKIVIPGNGKRPPFVKITGYRNLGEVTAAARSFYLRRSPETPGIDLPIPSVKHEVIRVTLTEEQRRLYTAVKTRWKSGSMDGKAARTYLRLVCNAACTASDKVKGRESPKLDALEVRVGEAGPREQFVVFTESRRFAEMCLERFKHLKPAAILGGDATLHRTHAVKAFTAGLTRMIVGTRAMARALNLQTAQNVVNLDYPWNPAEYAQRVGRVRRLGNPHPTINLIDIVSEDTIEADVLDAMITKLKLDKKVFELGDNDSVRRSIMAAEKALR